MQQDILNLLPSGVITTDKDGLIMVANNSAKRLLGFTEKDLLEGQPIQEYIKLEKGKFTRWLDRALEGKDEKSRQQYYPDQVLQPVKGENQHSINLTIQTIADANDSSKVSGALIVIDDISDEKRLKSIMYRYMEQELAEELLENPEEDQIGGDLRSVSILTSSISNYSTVTEQLSPKEVVEMLNEYFEQMVDAVFEYGGTLDQYIGHQLMAAFGTPLLLPDHEFMAIQAAVEMKTRLESFNAERIMREQQILQMNVGISSGSVISGNIGSSQRMEFTSTGDPVNLANSLRALGKEYDCSIIIDDNTYQACRERVVVRELERIKTKNECSLIYELIQLDVDSLNSATKKFIEQYQSGRDLYYQRNFKQAIPYFESAQQIRPNDKPTESYLSKAREYLNHDPSEDWDGSRSLN